MYDIIFISYHEPNAERNWQNLKQNFPAAKRIDGVNGVHEAHRVAAKKSLTKMFWVVDADAKIAPTFDFNIHPAYKEIRDDTVYVWRSQNPVNGLVYGYGGVKLLPKKLTKTLESKNSDVTTSISAHFMPMPEISNITEFNTDAFSAWRSAFRECAKLASRNIDRQNDSETERRLDIWCNVGTNALFGIDTIKGAKAGREFGKTYKDNPEVLNNINNFDWLYDEFQRKE